MSTNGVNNQDNLSKDEVGWYFVEQYYTTLSKSPSKLHLFYGTKSQFVYGLEAEVANVSVGRQDIQDRITKLEFQDCKVRISNVDTQASFDNIVIQVIGEISNKSEEPRKFVQTFVLAQQPSGYFVLNDILRYIKEEDEEVAEEAAPAETAPEAPAAEEAKPAEELEAHAKAEETEPAKSQLDTTVVDKKLEEASAVAKESPAVPAVATPVAAPVKLTESAPAPAASPAQVADPEKAEEEIAEEDTKKTEAPKEPTPTPVVSRAPATATTAPAPAEPEKPKEPPKPMTWASRAAAAAGPARPPVALPKPAPAATSASRPAAPAASPSTPAQAVPATKAAPAETTAPATSKDSKDSKESKDGKDSGNEWQTAGADSRRQNRPQSVSNAAQDKETTLGYVKYVTEKVEEDALRSHLEKFGPVVYFDINRSKNCAFIEFASPAGYQAAVAANPHVINGENILVEARRPKASAYGGSNYNPNRGNISGRGGRGNYENRNPSQSGGRGGFSGGQNRGRGGGAGGASRGRGGAQTTTA